LQFAGFCNSVGLVLREKGHRGQVGGNQNQSENIEITLENVKMRNRLQEICLRVAGLPKGGLPGGGRASLYHLEGGRYGNGRSQSSRYISIGP